MDNKFKRPSVQRLYTGLINSFINASRSDQLTIRKATFSAVNVFGQFDIFHHVGHYKLTLGPLHHYFMSEKKNRLPKYWDGKVTFDFRFLSTPS